MTLLLNHPGVPVVWHLNKFTCLLDFELQGMLRGYDQTNNLVMEDCHERVYSAKVRHTRSTAATASAKAKQGSSYSHGEHLFGPGYSVALCRQG